MRVPELNSRIQHSRDNSSAANAGRPFHSVRIIILTALLLFLSSVAGINRLCAQEKPTGPEPERIYPSLYPIRGGWIGVDRGRGTDRLLLYDPALRERAQTQWLDLHPLDVASLPSPWGDTAAILLAHPSGATVLFRVRTGTTPELEPIWQTTGAAYNTIVAVRKPILQSTPEIVLAGDSGLTAIRLDGTQAFVRPTRIIAFLRSQGNELIALERFGSAISVSWLDMTTGNVLAIRPLDSGGEGKTTLRRLGTNGTDLVVATSDPPTLFRFNNQSRGFQERIPLSKFPDAVLPFLSEKGTLLLHREYPAPRVEAVGGPTSSDKHLFYPNRSVFSDVLIEEESAGGLLLLVGKDSAAVYDKNLEYLCSVPTAGGGRPRLVPFGTGKERYVLASDGGSRIVEIRKQKFLWLRRAWPWILGALAALLLLWTGWTTYRHYRFIRAVYANLVQAPGTAGTIVTSGRGRVLQLNHSARIFLNVEGPVPLGRHISSYLQAEELRPVLDSIRRLLATGEPFEIELGRVMNGSQRTLRFQGRIMYGRYGGASGYILLIEDITASLERDRLVNWASVAHHIAHEMKTPLGTVRTTAELMRETIARHPEPERLAPSVQRIIRQSIRLREIVDDLLTVARTESLNRMETNLSLLFSSLIDEFSEYIPATIRLRYETRGSDFKGMVDPDQLTIAVRNLLVNARQAIGERESGEITLTLHGEPERLRVVVEDNGIGMAKTTLDRLFQPYYTEKEGGSGIGTVIVKRVVEGHGGTVEVESEQGVGARFILKLPREGN